MKFCPQFSDENVSENFSAETELRQIDTREDWTGYGDVWKAVVMCSGVEPVQLPIGVIGDMTPESAGDGVPW
jgi:hypothetical protein